MRDLTLEEAAKLLDKIRSAVADDDNEGAHVWEDELRIIAVSASFINAPQAKEIALLSLLARGFKYDRWYS